MSNIHLNQKKKRKKKKRGGNVKRATFRRKGKKKSEKSNVWTKPMCKCTRTFLSIMQPHFHLSVFSPFWRENFLVGLRRKHLDTTIYFPSSPVFIQPITFQNSFHSHFLPKVFYPPYFTSKQT